MVWARIDDEILDNEKVARAGALGFALHVAAISWCCRNLTDGFVPKSKVRTMIDLEEIGVDAMAVATELVDVELWDEEREDGELVGYRVHDFLKYNPSKAKVLEERERGKARAAKSAGASGEASPEEPPKLQAKPARSSDGSPPVLQVVPDPLPLPHGLHGSTSAENPSARARGGELPPWAVNVIEGAEGSRGTTLDRQVVWETYVAKRADEKRQPSELDFRGFVWRWIGKASSERASSTRLGRSVQPYLRGGFQIPAAAR